MNGRSRRIMMARAYPAPPSMSSIAYGPPDTMKKVAATSGRSRSFLPAAAGLLTVLETESIDCESINNGRRAQIRSVPASAGNPPCAVEKIMRGRSVASDPTRVGRSGRKAVSRGRSTGRAKGIGPPPGRVKRSSCAPRLPVRQHQIRSLRLVVATSGIIPL